jgi:hypothetical protein
MPVQSLCKQDDEGLRKIPDHEERKCFLMILRIDDKMTF